MSGPRGEIISVNVLCKQPGRFIGWPTIARAANGDLLTVFSGDRDAHGCMASKTQMIRSGDNGRSWSSPETINNTPMDDRDAGIVALSGGTLILSWFVSFRDPDHDPVIPIEMSNRDDYREACRPFLERITEQDKEHWLGGENPAGSPYPWRSGYWIRRSVDHGHTWEDPVKVCTSAPHGPVELHDGSLLFLGSNQHGNPDKDRRVIVQKSCDKGRTWTVETFWDAIIPAKNRKAIAEKFRNNRRELFDNAVWNVMAERDCRLAEPHAVEAEPGRIIGVFRGQPFDEGLWQAESFDDGKTWQDLRPIPNIWGKPPHLIRLNDGRLLLSYGHRREPFGQRACISDDGGRNWDHEHEIVLSNVWASDLGYPASVQLDDGTIITVYYEMDRPEEKPCLKATTWRLR